MKIQALLNFLQTLDPDHDVSVYLFKADQTTEPFEIMGLADNGGHAHINIFEAGFEPFDAHAS